MFKVGQGGSVELPVIDLQVAKNVLNLQLHDEIKADQSKKNVRD